MEREFLRPSDVADALGVKTGRVYQLIADKSIPGVEVAGAIRVPRRAWEQWLSEQNDRAKEAMTR